jgi:hypothetical protein
MQPEIRCAEIDTHFVDYVSRFWGKRCFRLRIWLDASGRDIDTLRLGNMLGCGLVQGSHGKMITVGDLCGGERRPLVIIKENMVDIEIARHEIGEAWAKMSGAYMTTYMMGMAA